MGEARSRTRRSLDRAGRAGIRRSLDRRHDRRAASGRRRRSSTEFDAASASSPDAIGLISWNEFSENSHVEPSVRYGRDYINVLADVGTTIRFSSKSDFDSSSSRAGIGYGLPILSGLFGLIFCALLVSFTRRHITHSQSSEPAETQAGVFNQFVAYFGKESEG